MRRSVVCLFLLVAGTASPAQVAAPATPAPASTTGAPANPDRPSRNWFSVYGRCREAVRTVNAHSMLDLCQQALELAQKTGDQAPRDPIALLQSYETYGQALLALGRGPDALAAENKAVDLAKAHFHDSDQEYAMPFYWRALVEAHFHDGTSASADLTLVENSYQKAMAASPRMRPIYKQYLARIFRQHAALLNAMGQSNDADKLRMQAANL